MGFSPGQSTLSSQALCNSKLPHDVRVPLSVSIGAYTCPQTFYSTGRQCLAASGASPWDATGSCRPTPRYSDPLHRLAARTVAPVGNARPKMRFREWHAASAWAGGRQVRPYKNFAIQLVHCRIKPRGCSIRWRFRSFSFSCESHHHRRLYRFSIWHLGEISALRLLATATSKYRRAGDCCAAN